MQLAMMGHGLAKTWASSPCLAPAHVPVRWRLDCAACETELSDCGGIIECR